MDKTIRRNENCIIGLPRCDFVFSSSRSCFVAYGFEDSPLEKDILCNLLEQSGIQAIEAEAKLAPGQSAFCAKICSKVITSQFCAVLLNNDIVDGREIPNANVNMEYGLMLGFNKYVLPFQREEQKLPFNVAGLDTIKYSSKNFSIRAKAAIDQAVIETEQISTKVTSPDQYVDTFLLLNRLIVSPLNDQGERELFDFGKRLGFNLVNDFTGLKYSFLGVFTALRIEVAISRVKLLQEMLLERKKSMESRLELGIATQTQANISDYLFNTLKFIVISNTDDDKEAMKIALSSCTFPVSIYSESEIITTFNDFNGEWK